MHKGKLFDKYTISMYAHRFVALPSHYVQPQFLLTLSIANLIAQLNTAKSRPTVAVSYTTTSLLQQLSTTSTIYTGGILTYHLYSVGILSPGFEACRLILVVCDPHLKSLSVAITWQTSTLISGNTASSPRYATSTIHACYLVCIATYQAHNTMMSTKSKVDLELRCMRNRCTLTFHQTCQLLMKLTLVKSTPACFILQFR